MELSSSDIEFDASYQDRPISQSSIILDPPSPAVFKPRKKRLPINTQQALKRYQKKVLGVLFDAWQDYTKNSINKYQKETQSRAHNRRRQLKRVLRYLIYSIFRAYHAYKVAQKLPRESASQFCTQHLLYKAFSGFYSNTLKSRDKNYAYEIASRFYNERLFRKSIEGFKNDERNYCVFLEKAMRCDYDLTCRRYFMKWLDYHRTRLIKNYKNVRAKSLRYKILKTKSIQTWKSYHYNTRIKKFKLSRASAHNNRRLIRTAFKGIVLYRRLRWARYKQYCKSIKHWSSCYYKKALFSWKKFTGMRLLKKQMLETAVEERRDDLRKDAMVLWMEISLKWNKQREERIIRDRLKKDEKLWKVVSRCARKWMNMTIRKISYNRRKIECKEVKRKEITAQKRITEKVRNIESDIVADACVPKKRPAPRRLPTDFIAKPSPAEPKLLSCNIKDIKEVPKPSKDFNIESINLNSFHSNKPTLKPADFSTPIKPKYSPISSIGFEFLDPTPQKTLPSSELDIFKRISEIEVELLNFKHEKNKLKEFNDKLRDDPYNEILYKQATSLKDKISCEVPRIRELFSEIQYLKNMSL
jgi:hypothetical protein